VIQIKALNNCLQTRQ